MRRADVLGRDIVFERCTEVENGVRQRGLGGTRCASKLNYEGPVPDQDADIRNAVPDE